METLQRKYLFSDTYGSSAASPLNRPDPDALITTDFHSQDREYKQREFDIYHDTEQTAHLLRMVLDLDAEAIDTLQGKYKDAYAKAITGIFINVAPRDKQGVNGEPFYVANAREGRIRVVSTPLAALSPLKHDIEDLEVLPNERNRLYGLREQFRSSYTPVLLYPDHEYELEPVDTADIPDPRQDWHVAYEDRFGNIITYIDSEAKKQRILEEIDTYPADVQLSLGGVSYEDIFPAYSLGEAEPGEVSIYQNGRNIDIARKWLPGEDSATKLAESAYHRLDQPTVGTTIALAKNREFAVE